MSVLSDGILLNPALTHREKVTDTQWVWSIYLSWVCGCVRRRRRRRRERGHLFWGVVREARQLA